MFPGTEISYTTVNRISPQQPKQPTLFQDIHKRLPHSNMKQTKGVSGCHRWKVLSKLKKKKKIFLFDFIISALPLGRPSGHTRVSPKGRSLGKGDHLILIPFL